MKRQLLTSLAAAAFLAGCNNSEEAMYAEEAAADAEFGFMEAREEGSLANIFGDDESQVVERVTTVDVAEAPPSSGNEIPVSIPQIAYTYAFGFRIAAEQMPALQARHVALCEELGQDSCRVIQMQSSGGEGDYAYGSLQLAVAAAEARAFGAQLTQTTEGEGGSQVEASISGEDLSKQIVDTEARLRARTLLRDRLMEVLRSRQGTVAELVEAERGVAQVNEEIDQAQSWLAEMRGRVQFSRIDVSYQSGAPSGGGFVEPIRTAVNSIGAILGTVIAALIIILTIALPVGLVVWGGLLVRRKLKKPEVVEAPVETVES